ncbi:MAG: amylo-alpha-1,6-glucosidase [Cyanobacteriota bacterium]|nr:amylo-alpha-1,6-glucosidase [Cyanobacteriota bacterium]
MTLQFGRDICGHLVTAEQREWLITNGIGGYGCGTVAGLLTRHYHGLLVAALRPPLDRTLLVTKLDETVVYGCETYALATNRWADGSISPHGYHYLERFALEGTIPTWTYALGDALLLKQIWMEQGSNTTYLRYHLRRASGPVGLSAIALINYRDHHGATQGEGWAMGVNPLAVNQPSGVKILAFEGATPFYLMADRGLCTPAHTWYEGYDLAVERHRGIIPHDDHLHCATFRSELAVGQSLTLVATSASPDTVLWHGALERQQAHDLQCIEDWYTQAPARRSAPWIEQLVLAADQFIVARPVVGESNGKTVIAGYPWFSDWGRDTMIALPGLTVATGRPRLARPILRTFAQYLDQGMLPNLFPEVGTAPQYNSVDAILWFFEAIRVYIAATQDRSLLKEIFPALVEVVGWHQQGTRYHIHLDTDGLIYAGHAGVQLTWMDAKVGDWVITPRIGKPIEINALWYNALLTLSQFSEALGQPSDDYRTLAEQTRQGLQRFWSDRLGHCYDVIDGPDGDDPSLRPNQIFAVALPGLNAWPQTSSQASPQHHQPIFSPLRQKAIVDRVAQTLLTSYGLRSLSPHHPNYAGHYGGDPVQRDSQYHQGPVWGWLMGPFVQAHWQVYQDSAAAQSFLAPLADHLISGCIGSLGEIFDGDAPHEPRGTFAQAWTVAEVLRVWCLLEQARS